MAAGVWAAGDQDVAGVPDALDLAFHAAELRRVALVIGGVEREPSALRR